MNLRVFIPLFFLLFACKKELSTQQKSLTPEPELATVSEPVLNPSDFSLADAKVYEKTGRKEEVTEVLDHLLYFQLVSRKDYNHLMRLNLSDSLKSNFDLIRNILSVDIISCDTIQTAFPAYYESLIGLIANKYHLNIEKLTLVDTVIEFPMEGIKEQQAEVNIISASKNYNGKIIKEEGNTLDENFYKVLNQILAAQGDSSRLYLARKIMAFETDSNLYYGTDKNEYAILKLTAEEAFALHQYPNVVDLSYEEHRFPFSKEEIDFAFSKLDSAGFLTGISNDEKTRFRKNIRNQNIFDIRDIFFYVEPLRICFSDYTDFKVAPYKTSLQSMQKFSKGKFKPENIHDDTQRNSTSEVSFTLNNKEYTVSCQNGLDRFDIQSLIDLVNSSLNDQKIDGNFYLLNNLDSEHCYIFMNEGQVNMANQLLKP